MVLTLFWRRRRRHANGMYRASQTGGGFDLTAAKLIQVGLLETGAIETMRVTYMPGGVGAVAIT